MFMLVLAYPITMRICFLTQTASDISAYYKEFFKGQDLFFVTFKKENPNAVAFLPKSTWSAGRNALWEHVKGMGYTHLCFIDDDITFFGPRVSLSPRLAYLCQRLYFKDLRKGYAPLTSELFMQRLTHWLTTYQPEVLAPLSFEAAGRWLDISTQRAGSWVRRLGWFDAQMTVLSAFAASKILPYDEKLSGWWSSQIPVYNYAYHVFRNKALAISDIAVDNNHHVGAAGSYVAGYNGFDDVRSMLSAMGEVTGKDFTGQYSEQTAVDNAYWRTDILARLPQPADKEDYAVNYQQTLAGLENLLHPAVAL
jgi:hypothetical protein